MKTIGRRVTGALIVACFVGGGWLASSYFNTSPPTKPDYSNTVWKEQQRGHVVTPNPAPTTTTPTQDNLWEGI